MVNDTIHFKVDTFSFTDIDNNSITEKDFEDKILVVNFISGKCPDDSLNVCPINFMEFKRYVYDDFVNDIDFDDGMKRLNRQARLNDAFIIEMICLLFEK